MGRKIALLLLLIGISYLLQAQKSENKRQGTVSLMSTQSVYVRFYSTTGISPGDTLYINRGGKMIPALTVKALSSASCMCKPFPGIKLSVSQVMIAHPRELKEKPAVRPVAEISKDTTGNEFQGQSPEKKSVKKNWEQKITGSVSAYSYSNFLNKFTSASTQFRYTLSLDARHIADSRISFNTYASFRHDPEKWDEIKNNLFSALKIYSLSLGFDASKSTHMTLGRTINPKIASIGAMDGIQIEQRMSKFSLGLLAGFRPAIEDYGFDKNLFQYGAWLSYSSGSEGKFNETSVAVMEQTNNSKTDRRFIYFQHSNSLIKSIYFLSTFDVDLYKLDNGLPVNTFDPTGLYLYLRFKMTKSISLSASYDARKNITYYESYKSFLDRLLENEMRQSYRLQADYRITGNISIGVQAGYRNLKTDPMPSRNINVYFNYFQIPGIKLSPRLSASYLESSYITSKILGINVGRDMFKGKLNADLGYHYMENEYPENNSRNIQNIGELNISWFIFRKTSISANYEGIFEESNRYTRIFLQIRQRF